MRVLFFYFSELGGLGGVEMTVLRLAEALLKRGDSPGIVEISSGWKAKRIHSAGIPVWGVTAPSYPSLWRPRSWASFVRTTWQFTRVLREFQADVVHVHYPLTQALPVVGADTFPRPWSLVVTVHGSDIRVAPFESPPIRAWQARLFNRADAVTAVSGKLLEDAVRLYPCLMEKSRVIPNGVGPEWFEPSAAPSGARERYLLYVGRLHPVKGVDILLRAWKRIAADFTGVQLWLVGEGPERRNLIKLADQLELSARVRFIEKKEPQELRSLYHDAEIVVLPSRMEGLPLTVLEAGACSGLCVGTRVGGIPEAIQDGVTGYLVEPESPEALAVAIARVLRAAPEERLRIREMARRAIGLNFSEEKVISSYMNLFGALREKSNQV